MIKFCEEFSEWKHAREKEINIMVDIKDRDDQLNMNFNHVKQSENKGKASLEFKKSKLTQKTADSKHAELEKELDEVLTETLEGLEKLYCFVDAVGKLAITSPNVLTDNQLLHRPEEMSIEIFIAAAQLFCPLLLELKRDSEIFSPKLQNVEEMKKTLNRYIQTSEEIFECLGKSFISKACLKMETDWPVNGINQLDEKRKQLQKALCCYTTDTLTYIKKVNRFCEEFSEWKHAREQESNTMVDIKDRADKLNMNFSHVTQSENKGKAFLEFVNSKLPKMTADNRHEELEKELDKVLTETLEGLENLSCFLDAVAKLAVTSLPLFTDKQLFHLPEEMSLEYVQIIIAAARLFCPLLLVFKTDAKIFFLPKLQNVEVLKHQLDRYIQTSEKIFECLGKSFIIKVCLKMKNVDDQNVYWSVDSIQHIDQINQLDEIRLDPDLRMVFLFREISCSHFINEFNKQKSGMLQSLNELEQCAVQLDNMNKGAKISSVAGSSVGAVGGVLSIVGLALAPVTAGVSLALTMTGVGLGVTSAVNSAVTTGTEIGVNVTQQKKANEMIQKFMEGVQALQNCLLNVDSQPISGVGVDKTEVTLAAGKIATEAVSIGKSIDSAVDAASAFKVLQSEEQIVTTAGRLLAQEGKALHNAPRVASDLPEFGQAVVKAPLALSETMRGLFIAGNVLFLGMDILFICKDSISLTKGSETEVSQFIRARAALWHSEFDSWQKIHDSLNEGLKKLKKKERS